MAFVHLHNRSQYSILDGAMRPSEIVAQAKALDMEAIALTDTQPRGAVEFTRPRRAHSSHLRC